MDDNDIGFMDADLDPEMDHEASLSFEQHMANRTWKSLEAIHINEGYRQGLEIGKERTLQQGFDLGYKQGLALGRALGQLRGQLASALAAYEKQSIGLEEDATWVASARALEQRLHRTALLTEPVMIRWLSGSSVEQLTQADAPTYPQCDEANGCGGTCQQHTTITTNDEAPYTLLDTFRSEVDDLIAKGLILKIEHDACKHL